MFNHMYVLLLNLPPGLGPAGLKECHKVCLMPMYPRRTAFPHLKRQTPFECVCILQMWECTYEGRYVYITDVGTCEGRYVYVTDVGVHI